MKILILCTGNSCRSQMAQGFLQSFDKNLIVRSAGTVPAKQVNQKAVKVMSEVGIDISHHTPKMVDEYINEEWDYVITVCDDANETCPAFFGKVKHRMHIGFEDPSNATETAEFIWSEFRRVRDLIKDAFYKLYSNNLKINKMKDIKKVVQEKYSYIANQTKQQNETSCCGGTSCCGEVDYTIFSDDYSHLKGYNKDADLGLGCGLPTKFAGIKSGDSVLDLGSGAGNDCFVARAIVGETGKVTGIDFTDAMIEKAKINAGKLGYTNIEFVKGDIEEMPLPDSTYDVVISNCVLNLVPDKQKAFKEIYRVLKSGGHFCVSDVVILGNLPGKIKQDAEMYAGCVSGAIQKDEYLKIIKENGFRETIIHKEKEIEIPNNILLNYMTLDELRKFKKDKTGIFSITVTANK